MNEGIRARLNVGRFQEGDVVTHCRYGGFYRVVKQTWRGETLVLKNLDRRVKLLDQVIYHPRFLCPVENAMVVLAAAALGK